MLASFLGLDITHACRTVSCKSYIKLLPLRPSLQSWKRASQSISFSILFIFTKSVLCKFRDLNESFSKAGRDVGEVSVMQLCSRLTDTRPPWLDSFVSWTSMLRITLSLFVRKSSKM